MLKDDGSLKEQLDVETVPSNVHNTPEGFSPGQRGSSSPLRSALLHQLRRLCLHLHHRQHLEDHDLLVRGEK